MSNPNQTAVAAIRERSRFDETPAEVTAFDTASVYLSGESAGDKKQAAPSAPTLAQWGEANKEDEGPNCARCGTGLTTGLMAAICPHREECEFWPDDEDSQDFLDSFEWRLTDDTEHAHTALRLALKASDAALQAMEELTPTLLVSDCLEMLAKAHTLIEEAKDLYRQCEPISAMEYANRRTL